MLHVFRLLLLTFTFLLVSSYSKGNTVNSVNDPHQSAIDQTYLNSKLDSLKVFGNQKNWEGIIDISYNLENFAEMNEDRDLLTRMIILRAVSLHSLGSFNQAVTCYLRLIDIYENSADSAGLASALNSIGRLYIDMGDFAVALKYLYRGISIAEKSEDSFNLSILYHSASIVHFYQNDLGRCEYCLKESERQSKLKLNRKVIPAIQEIHGLLMADQKNFNQAQKLYLQSLSGYKNLGDSLSIASVLDNLGVLSRQIGRYEESIDFHRQSISIKSKQRSLKSLPVSYYNLAEVYLKKGILDSSLYYADKSIMLAEGFKMQQQINITSALLSSIYQSKGDYSKAYHWMLQHQNIYNDIFSPQNIRAVVQMEADHEFEKKYQQQALESEKQELILKEKAKRSKLIGRYLGLSAILAIVAFLFALRSYNMKRKHTKVLEEQKEEILVQNEEIMAQQESLFELNEELMQKNETISAHLEEIESQRDSLENLAHQLQEKADLVEKQRDLLFRQKKELTDSIIYAERIQQACLPTKGIFKEVFPDSFVFYRPKNIISGDFYLINIVRGYKILAIGDCTGHGVPGGLLSMLGIAFLNNIINKDHVTTSSEVLEEMRKQIIHSLHQYNPDLELDNNDGMDMAVCALNTNTMELQFSGANIPTYIFKKNNGVIHDKPIVLKEDRMPISHYICTQPFTNKSVKVESGDMIYMFTDGFTDQFGEKEGKKFNIARFRTLLASIHHLDSAKQHEIISTTFDEWKGERNQIDDVLVMGVRV